MLRKLVSLLEIPQFRVRCLLGSVQFVNNLLMSEHYFKTNTCTVDTSQTNLKLVSFCPISDKLSVTVVFNIMQLSRSS